MSLLSNAPVHDLREILKTLCKENDTALIRQIILLLTPSARNGTNALGANNALDLIQKGNSQELCLLASALSSNDAIKKRINGYLAALGLPDHAQVDREAAIKNATAKELRTVMLALCDDDERILRRVALHIRILRGSTVGAPTARKDPISLVNSASEAELRAIALGEKATRKPLSGALQVVSIFGMLPSDSGCKAS